MRSLATKWQKPPCFEVAGAGYPRRTRSPGAGQSAASSSRLDRKSVLTPRSRTSSRTRSVLQEAILFRPRFPAAGHVRRAGRLRNFAAEKEAAAAETQATTGLTGYGRPIGQRRNRWPPAPYRRKNRNRRRFLQHGAVAGRRRIALAALGSACRWHDVAFASQHLRVPGAVKAVFDASWLMMQCFLEPAPPVGENLDGGATWACSSKPNGWAVNLRSCWTQTFVAASSPDPRVCPLAHRKNQGRFLS